MPNQFIPGQRLVYWRKSRHEFVTFHSVATLDGSFVIIEGETQKKLVPNRFLFTFEQDGAITRINKPLDHEKLSRIHQHIRNAQHQNVFCGAIYAQFKPLPFRAYSDALTILETISQLNGGKLGTL